MSFFQRTEMKPDPTIDTNSIIFIKEINNNERYK